MSTSQKFTTVLLSVLLISALSACSSSAGGGSNTSSEKTQETKAADASRKANIKQGAEQMRKIAVKLENAGAENDVDQVKKLGKALNDQWFTFESGVRSNFPLLYTKVEKYEMPIYGQSTLEKPDLAIVKKNAGDLKKALVQLKNSKVSARKGSGLLEQAVSQYKSYVKDQADQLVKRTKKLAEAVKAGKIEEAKARYADARVYYERIEPIAESFGGLDPAIDARINDVEDKANWSGFHRLEKAIWKDGSLRGQKKYADQLLSDVKRLREKVGGVSLNAKQIVAGSMELLNEAAISKISGEEERYSHLDLVDLVANVHGSEAVYRAIIPTLNENNKDLADRLDDAFGSFYKELDKYKTENDGYV
ncbi:MAG TPA: iron uptake system protein EfeO, partial [Bacillales bacterium]|nr:iron uptake system protein EfeO [Bacillales bacterium]